MRTRSVILTTISAFLLTACGVRGSLKTPPPIWGEEDKAPAERSEPGTETPAPEDAEDLEDFLPE